MRFVFALLLVYAFHAPAFATESKMPGTALTPVGGQATLAPAERRWLTQESGTIRIGITIIPPQVIRTSNGYGGLAIDYIRLMEQKLHCQFALVPFATWNEVIQAAKDRRIDMIFAAQQTPERLGYLLFSEPYIELPNMIVVRRDRREGHDLKQMKGWSVAVSAGSAVHEYLKEQYPQLNLRPVSDELGGLMNVSLGEADAMVVEISRASYYIQKAGIMNLRVAGDAGLVYRLRFAVRNDLPMLRRILDKGLASITPAERQEISRRWIVVEPATVFATRAFRIWFSAVTGAVILGIMGIMIWNRTLRNQVRQRTRQLQEELAERKSAEESLQRLNRELMALSNCNQALIKAEDEQTFLNEVCRIICEEAGYPLVWVGYREHDGAKTLRAVAWAGTDGSFLASARLSCDESEWDGGQNGASSRTGRSCCIQDFAADPKAGPWREVALRQGYRSSISLPLQDENDKAFGALAIYSAEANAFTEEEIRLLEELAGDLAFGIQNLRNRSARQKAEEKILETNERFRSVLRAATAYSIIGTDQDGIITVFNVGAEQMLGYGAAEVVDRATPLLFHDQNEVAARAAEIGIAAGFEVFAAAARKGETEARPWTYIRKDGSRIDVSLTVTAMRDEAGELTGFIGVAQDITERKRNEELLYRQATELEQEVAERQRTQEELQVLNRELEERVRERTAELESKYEEVARLNKVFVGRELRMVDLKNELRALKGSQMGESNGKKP